MMIDTVELPHRLGRLGPDHMGFDVEMANSFRDELPVICMLGVEQGTQEPGRCISTIATITRREEEPELIRWFLDTLREFAARHARPKQPNSALGLEALQVSLVLWLARPCQGTCGVPSQGILVIFTRRQTVSSYL